LVAAEESGTSGEILDGPELEHPGSTTHTASTTNIDV
jgi:hypothetical protein